MVAVGRCFFEPILIGTTFDTWARLTAESWQRQEGEVRVVVSDIEVYGQFIDELSQTMTARVHLRGSVPDGFLGGDEDLLVAAEQPSDAQWRLDGPLWHRSS